MAKKLISFDKATEEQCRKGFLLSSSRPMLNYDLIKDKAWVAVFLAKLDSVSPVVKKQLMRFIGVDPQTHAPQRLSVAGKIDCINRLSSENFDKPAQKDALQAALRYMEAILKGREADKKPLHETVDTQKILAAIDKAKVTRSAFDMVKKQSGPKTKSSVTDYIRASFALAASMLASPKSKTKNDVVAGKAAFTKSEKSESSTNKTGETFFSSIKKDIAWGRNNLSWIAPIIAGAFTFGALKSSQTYFSEDAFYRTPNLAGWGFLGLASIATGAVVSRVINSEGTPLGKTARLGLGAAGVFAAWYGAGYALDQTNTIHQNSHVPNAAIRLADWAGFGHMPGTINQPFIEPREGRHAIISTRGVALYNHNDDVDGHSQHNRILPHTYPAGTKFCETGWITRAGDYARPDHPMGIQPNIELSLPHSTTPQYASTIGHPFRDDPGSNACDNATTRQSNRELMQTPNRMAMQTPSRPVKGRLVIAKAYQQKLATN